MTGAVACAKQCMLAQRVRMQVVHCIRLYWTVQCEDTCPTGHLATLIVVAYGLDIRPSKKIPEIPCTLGRGNQIGTR